MGVRFACHNCGKALNIKNELAGKRGKCPACGTRFRIPLADQEHSIPLRSGVDESADENGGGSDADMADDSGPLSTPDSDRANAPHSAPPIQRDSASDFNPLDEPQVLWYVRPPTGGRYGPADGPTVMTWINEGRVTPDTLLWREGWPQWRECREVVPGQSAVTGSAVHSGASSQAHLGVDPGVTPERAYVTAAPIGKSAGSSPYDPDAYLGAKKRRRAKQRATLIAILIATSVLLVIALTVAMLWPRRASEESRLPVVNLHQLG